VPQRLEGHTLSLYVANGGLGLVAIIIPRRWSCLDFWTAYGTKGREMLVYGPHPHVA
jgi:hypothetical protein